MSQWNTYYTYGSNTSSATTWTYTQPVTITVNPTYSEPKPRTEVERLLSEVEAVCALAR